MSRALVKRSSRLRRTLRTLKLHDSPRCFARSIVIFSILTSTCEVLREYIFSEGAGLLVIIHRLRCFFLPRADDGKTQSSGKKGCDSDLETQPELSDGRKVARNSKLVKSFFFVTGPSPSF